MKKALTKSVLTVALAAGSLVTLPACTDGELIASSIIVGAAIIGSDNDGHYYDRGHRRDRSYRPIERRGRGGRGHIPPRRHYAYSLEQAGATTSALETALASQDAAAVSAGEYEFVSTDERVIKVADKYAISDYAATYVVRAVVLAQAKDLSGIAELGLEKSDMKKLAEGKELKAEKIEKMSAKLMLSTDETERLVKELSEDIQAEKAAKNI